MHRSRSIRASLIAVLGVLFLFAAFEPVMAHCGGDDADGACCMCLCTQALDTPDPASKTDLPKLILEAARLEVTSFQSLTFPPPSPPPWA